MSSRRLISIATGIVVCAIASLYWSMSNQYFFALSTTEQFPTTVLVKNGRPDLAAFHWLPARPGFGSTLADTGLTREYFDATTWRSFDEKSLSASGSKTDYGTELLKQIRPDLQNILRYAAQPNDAFLKKAWLAAEGLPPEDIVFFFKVLTSAFQGTAGELHLVDQALALADTSVRRAALQFLVDAAAEGCRPFQSVIQSKIQSGEGAISETLRKLIAPKMSPQLDKLAEAANLNSDDDPQPAQPLRERLEKSLADLRLGNASDDSKVLVKSTSALRLYPELSHKILEAVIADAKAPESKRIRALEMVLEVGGNPPGAALSSSIQGALKAKSLLVRTKALVALAKVDSSEALKQIHPMFEADGQAIEMQRAFAQSIIILGPAIPKSVRATLRLELAALLTAKDDKLRSRALEALGSISDSEESRALLLSATQDKSANIRRGALLGLAAQANRTKTRTEFSALLADDWARSRRKDANVAHAYAFLGPPYSDDAWQVLTAALGIKRNPALNLAGVHGLCKHAAAGDSKILAAVRSSIKNSSQALRLAWLRCLQSDPLNAVQMAQYLAADKSKAVRLGVAETLEARRDQGQALTPYSRVIALLLKDRELSVLGAVLRAIDDANQKLSDAVESELTARFESGDEKEKVFILNQIPNVTSNRLLNLASRDDSPLVRVAALESATGRESVWQQVLTEALQDQNTKVGVAALKQITAHPPADLDLDRHLMRAVANQNSTVAKLALDAFVKGGGVPNIVSLLENDLASQESAIRARAAQACALLVERAPQEVEELLASHLRDPERAVRLEVARSLAMARAKTLSPRQLVDIVAQSERLPLQRWVAAAALMRAPSAADEKRELLGQLKRDAGPMAAIAGQLSESWLAADRVNFDFVTHLVP